MSLPDSINVVKKYIQLGDIALAKTKINEILKSHPKSHETHYLLSIINLNNNSANDAILNINKAIELEPKKWQYLNQLAEIYRHLNDFETAIITYHKALRINPNNSEIYNNLGILYFQTNNYDAAFKSFNTALIINPDFNEISRNIGFAFYELNNPIAAMSFYKKSLSLNPDDPETHFKIAITLLLTGEFQRGWDEYNWRFLTNDWHKLTLKYVPNDIKKITDINLNKKIIIHAEQGLGDTIQFIRYLPLLRDKIKSDIQLNCQPELIKLLKDSLKLNEITDINTFDFPENVNNIHLLNLPYLFNTTLDTIPANIPYIYSNKSLNIKWKKKINKNTFNIGLVWAGRSSHLNDNNRSISVEEYTPIFNVSGVTFYSLQKDLKAENVTKYSNLLIDYTDELKDFSETAALIDQLDLIITVDTAVAHLAGAMGKFVWTLLPFVPDWRWLLERDDTPWYPTMKLYRQSKKGNWAETIDQVKNDLINLTNN